MSARVLWTVPNTSHISAGLRLVVSEIPPQNIAYKLISTTRRVRSSRRVPGNGALTSITYLSAFLLVASGATCRKCTIASHMSSSTTPSRAASVAYAQTHTPNPTHWLQGWNEPCITVCRPNVCIPNHHSTYHPASTLVVYGPLLASPALGNFKSFPTHTHFNPHCTQNQAWTLRKYHISIQDCESPVMSLQSSPT